MSRKKRTSGEKRKASSRTRLPMGHAPAPPQNGDRKLSEIIKEMAWSILKDPDAIPSLPAAQAAVILATIAWNRSVGHPVPRDEYRLHLAQLNWNGTTPWAELRCDDADQLQAELVARKRERHLNDVRRIVGTEVSDEGNVRVHWVNQETITAPHFGSTRNRPSVAPIPRARPIADRLVKAMKKHLGQKVISFKSAMVGRDHAEALQKTVATQKQLADLHPAHAVYVYAQNQVSVMSEQLTALQEMAAFVKLISAAEDEYLPSGPPMSPLTASFFTCWAFFDACIGEAEETIGTTIMAVGAAFGMHEELLRVIGLMQKSRMGVYIHEGGDKNAVMLRELVTNRVCRAIVPSGYGGQPGELWYVRVLPPPLPGLSEHVVFTTPYLLLWPGESEWQAYFRRALPDASLLDRGAHYEHHIKFGPTRNYWTEFVFEAYVNHRTDVILLAGLPDVPESRPHSRVNQR